MVIIYTSSRRAVLRRFAALLIAPQRFVCYNAAPCVSAYLGTTYCSDPPRTATQRSDLFVTPLHFATLRSSAFRFATLCAATICLLLRRAPLCYSARRTATQLGSTICFLLRYTTLRSASLRSSAIRIALHRSSTICLLQREECKC
jgi:hypothetical protein